ncbi:MAG: PQQ-like beta-propeller repeat protein [Myxococcaceae bacterium]|nr:PQQ-like beta-propeller repeat protein [Myxococcaceae bacterium]
MIRLRIGRRWKHERSAAPMDSIALEVEGVNLLSGASEEPLEETVPALVDAVHGLACRGERLAQLSLPEAHLEVGFIRHGAEVELRVVSLARPARLVRPGVRVELEELVEGVAKGAHAHVKELQVHARARGAGSPRVARMESQLAALGRALPPPVTASAPIPFHDSLPSPGPFGFGAELEDPEDLLRGLGREGHAALTSLLCGGTVTLHAGGRPPWTARGAPFLVALELSRQGHDLLRAVDAGEPALSFRPAGVAPALELDLVRGRIRCGAAELAGSPRELAAAMFELGLALAAHITQRNPAQARNPYLTELTTRCTRGLAHLREEAQPPPSDQGAAPVRPRRSTEGRRALERAGTLRRLRFERRWEVAEATMEPQARLLLTAEGCMVVDRAGVRAFSREGGLVVEREGAHGAAAAADGSVVVATADRLLFFDRPAAGAHWFRSDPEGLRLEAVLFAERGQLVVVSRGRTLLALSEATGRELWRAASPLGARVHVAVLGHRVLVASDAGVLSGLDLADGRLRFRTREALPFVGPPSAWGPRAVALLNSGEHSALWVGSPHTGETAWTHELSLSMPTPPHVRGSRVHLLGARGTEAVLLALGTDGRVRWERSVPLGRGPFALASHGRALLAASADGTAVRVGPTGTLEWRLGAAGEPLTSTPAPVVRRGVAFLPGAAVRAVEPRGGRELARVETRAPLRALAVDSRLTLYLLDEDGTLAAHRLASHLGVLSRA